MSVLLTSWGCVPQLVKRTLITRYECPFNELGYKAPQTPIAQLQVMRCISADIPQANILIFLYEFICGVLTEATPYIIKKQPFDMYDVANNFEECKQLEGVSLQKLKEAVLNKYVEVLHE